MKNEIKQTGGVAWLVDWMKNNQYFIGNDLLEAADRAKEIENEQINRLPIHIHEGVSNINVYIENRVVHIKPNKKG